MQKRRVHFLGDSILRGIANELQWLWGVAELCVPCKDDIILVLSDLAIYLFVTGG